MPVHRRMPVIAAEESGGQFSGWGHIRITVQGVTKLVRIFLVEAREASLANRSAALTSNWAGAAVP
jgi:hypothetical protein